jgi:hypothetical protein
MRDSHDTAKKEALAKAVDGPHGVFQSTNDGQLQSGRWKANITYDGTKMKLGVFATEEIAANKFDEGLAERLQPDLPVDLPTSHIVTTLTAPALFSLDKKLRRFELHKQGPLMCAIVGSWTSYSLM